MSLFTNPIRPAPLASDAAVRRYVEAIRQQIEPDPLYRRRLRGQVVNRFVARKRGIDLTGPRRPSRMGALGRACLYASFALAVTVTGVMAASDAAIPGDVLYPLKRSIEEMRFDVLPDESVPAAGHRLINWRNTSTTRAGWRTWASPNQISTRRTDGLRRWAGRRRRRLAAWARSPARKARLPRGKGATGAAVIMEGGAGAKADARDTLHVRARANTHLAERTDRRTLAVF